VRSTVPDTTLDSPARIVASAQEHPGPIVAGEAGVFWITTGDNTLHGESGPLTHGEIVTALALDGTVLYYASCDALAILRIPARGGDPERVASTSTCVRHLEALDGQVYFLDGKTLNRACGSTHAAPTVLLPGTDLADFALDAGRIFGTVTDGTITGARLDGSGASILVTGIGATGPIAASGGRVAASTVHRTGGMGGMYAFELP
jgi:hypothetical protein